MQNNKNKQLEPNEEKIEETKSEFSIRYANSLIVNQNEDDDSQSSNAELKFKKVDSQYSQGEIVSQQTSNKDQMNKDKYQNMDGEKILRYIKAKLKTNPFQRWQMRNSNIHSLINYLYLFNIPFLMQYFRQVSNQISPSHCAYCICDNASLTHGHARNRLHPFQYRLLEKHIISMQNQVFSNAVLSIIFIKNQKIDPDDEDNKNSKFFFTPTDLKENLDETMSFFQDIQSQTQFDVVDYWQTKFYILSYYTIWPTDKTHRLSYIDEINLPDGIVKPFNQNDNASIKQYIQKVNMFSLIVSNLQTKFSVNSNICWDIKIQYIIESGIKVEASVDADQVMCQKSGSPPQDDEDKTEENLQKLKQRFKRNIYESMTSDEIFKLKQQINSFSQKAQQNKRRLIAESLSDNYIQQQWDKFQVRKDRYSSLTKPSKRGYQRIAAPYKFNSKDSYRPRRILVPIKKLKDKNDQTTTRNNHGFQTLFVNFMVILLASSLFFLHMKYVYRIFVLYECAKQATERTYLQNIRLNQSKRLTSQNQQGSLDADRNVQSRKIKNIYDNKHSLKWENITFTEKLKFFNKWQLLSMVGHFFQICGSILLFVSQYTLEKNAQDNKFSFIFNLKERLIGFGCALAWITIVQYVEYDQEHIIFSNLMGKVVKQWLYTLIGILPVFMAFALVGYALYSESKFFHNMSYTLTTLFATYHGDQISDFMNSIKDINSPLHQFYMLTFTCLFAMAVYNFFTSTIGLAWDEIKEKKKNKLLKQQLKENYLIEEELYKAKNNTNARDSGRNPQEFRSVSEMRQTQFDSPTSNRNSILPNLMGQSSAKKQNKALGGTQMLSSSSELNPMDDNIIVTSENAFDKLNEFMNKNKQDKQKISEKIDKHKKFIWTDTISKKNQIEQLFKEMVEFDQIIDVLDIDHSDKAEIKAKYRRYFNFTINSINKLIDDISSI